MVFFQSIRWVPSAGLVGALGLDRVRNSQLSCTLESLEDSNQDSDPLTSLSKTDVFVRGLEPQDRSCLKPPRGADVESGLGLCMLDQDRLQNLPDGLWLLE